MGKQYQKKYKRLVDFLGALIGLLILSPLFLIIAVLIKLDSKGSVFFSYERVGKGGKLFKPFKFRSMREGAINQGLGYNIAKDDERITKLGKFLRRTGIDELPQFIDVLKGEMSLVGPRPTFKYQVDKYTDFQRKRLLMKPGITGLALIYSRSLLPWEERIKYDVWYVENWSFWLDFKILLKTPWVILSGKGLCGEKRFSDSSFNK